MCQLEGCDRGGRDSAAELALAGGFDVEVGQLLQPADFGFSPDPTTKNYTRVEICVNDFVDPRVMRFTGVPFIEENR